MTIRTLSPFPIEHVYWGWYKDQHYPWIFIYAATKDSLNRAGYGELEPFQQVFPSFLTTIPLTFEEPTLYYFYHPHTQTLTLHIHPGKQVVPEVSEEGGSEADANAEDSEEIILPDIQLPIIHSVQVVAAEPDFDDERVEEEELEEGELRMPTFEDISDAREHLQAQLPDPDQYQSQDNWLEYVVATTTKDGSIHFHHQWGSTSEPQPGPETEVSRTQAWQADVRSLEFKNEARQKRKREHQLLLAAQIAGIVAILLVFLEFASIAGEKWSLAKSEKATAAQPKIDVILGKRELLFKIEQVSTNNLVPFKMLQSLNNHRSGGIYFEEVEASEGNRMLVEGQAKSGGEMNAYKKALIDSKVVLTCELEMVTKGGILHFEMDMTFPPYQAPPTPRPASRKSTETQEEPPSENFQEEDNPLPPGLQSPGGKPTQLPPGFPPGMTPPTKLPPSPQKSANPNGAKSVPSVPPFPIPTNNATTKPSSPPQSTPPTKPSPSPKAVPVSPPATKPVSKPAPGKPSKAQPKPPSQSSSVATPKETPTTKPLTPPKPKSSPAVPGFPTPTPPPPRKTIPTPDKSTGSQSTKEVKGPQEVEESKPPSTPPSAKPKIAPPTLPPGFPPPPPLPSNK